MRRVRKSTYVFDAGKLRSLCLEKELDIDQIQGYMRARGHRVDVSRYMVGSSVPSSEVLIDLLDILGVDVSGVVKALFVKRKNDEN